MPGPASPKRKAKQLEAKARARAERTPVRDFTLPQNYAPKPDSVIHTIPLDTVLTEEGKEWWDEWGGKGGEFEDRQGNKGDKQGAMAWVREKFVLRWWLEFYPRAADAPELDRAWFFKHSGMGRKLYAYLDNWHKRHPEDPNPPDTPKAIKKRKKRAYGHDYWRRENMDIHEEAIRLWKEEHERDPNFGEARSVSSQEFKKLPLEEQKEWKAKARNALAASRALAKISDPAERTRYIDDTLAQIQKLAEQAEEIAGVQMLTLVVYEKEDGKFYIGREVSGGLRAFGKSETVGHTMTALQGHIQKSVGLGVINPFPKPATYPDYANGNIPRIPSFMGWGTDECRKLHREFIKSMAGFSGRFIWKDLKERLDYYFDPKRLPCREFDESSRLPMPVLLVHLQFFFACQTGKVPDDMMFQFFRVPAGSGPVIHPSESQETDREVIERDGKKIIVLVFKNRVTKCHQPDGKMRFEQAGTDYADFLALGMTHAHAITAPPESWLQLPSAGPTIPNAVISGHELERLNIWAELLPDASKNRITRLIEATNEHQAHIPATHPKGVYLRRGPVPLIIPPSVLHSRVSETTWGPSCYFQPSAPEEGTIYYFKVYQRELRETDIIRHQPSKSYFGGDTGIVRVVRALIQLYLNCCAVRGDLKPAPPEDPPADLDLTRFPVNEYDRIASWIDAWTSSITQDTEILRKSFLERKKGLAGIPKTPADSYEPTGNVPSSSAGSSPIPAAHQANTPLNAPAGSVPRKKKSTLRAEDEETDDEEEIDFEGLDLTGQDSGTNEDRRLRLNGDGPPDSTYLGGDKLGLRARYHFDPAVPHLVIDYTGDGKLESWTRVASVFADPPRLPEYVAPCLTRPESFLRMLCALESEAKKAIEAWRLFCTNNPQTTAEIEQDVEEYAEDSEEDLQPLYRAKYRRQLLWMRAAAMAPTVFAHWRSMLYILREGTALFATLEKMLEREAFPDPEATALVLKDYVHKAKEQTVHLECYCYELGQYQETATKHYNMSKGAWSAGTEPETVGELAAISQSILDWIDDTLKVGRRLKDQRTKVWKDVLSETAPSTRNTVYYFGCPARSERIEGLAESIIKNAGDESRWDNPDEPDPTTSITSNGLSPLPDPTSSHPTGPNVKTANSSHRGSAPGLALASSPDVDMSPPESAPPLATGMSTPTGESMAAENSPPRSLSPAAGQQQIPQITISADETAEDTGSGANADTDEGARGGKDKDDGLGWRDGEDHRMQDRSSEAPVTIVSEGGRNTRPQYVRRFDRPTLPGDDPSQE